MRASTGFQAYRQNSLDLSSNLEAIAEVFPSHYQKLYERRIDGRALRACEASGLIDARGPAAAAPDMFNHQTEPRCIPWKTMA